MTPDLDLDADPDRHPSLNDLVAYAAGDRSPTPAVVPTEHLTDCPGCAATVATYRLARSVVAADAASGPSPALLARAKGIFSAVPAPAVPAPGSAVGAAVRRFVASLGFDSRVAPTLAGLRADADADLDAPYQLSYASDAGDVDLEVEPPPPGGGAFRVLGQLADPPARSAPAAVALLPAGAADGQAVAEAEADEYGFFVVAAPAGNYSLQVRLPATGALVVLPDLTLGPG